MHSLETLHRLNAEATEKAIKHYRDQGRWVVARYTGLHIAGIETFTDPAEANAAVRREVDSPDQRLELHAPTPDAERIGTRDQTEDRTLGDYIDRVARDEGISVSHSASVAGVTLTAKATTA